jgi:hypothetical protein
MKTFNIQIKAEKLVGYVYTATNKSPKKLRCDIIPMLRLAVQDVLNNIIKANHYRIDDQKEFEKRKEYQQEALIKLRILEANSEICTNMKYLTDKQLEVISRLSQELYDMIVNWTKSDLNRCTTE